MENKAIFYTDDDNLKPLARLLENQDMGGFSVKIPRGEKTLEEALEECRSPKSLNNILFLDANLYANSEDMVEDIQKIKFNSAGIIVCVLNGPQDYIGTGADFSIPRASAMTDHNFGSQLRRIRQGLLDNFRRYSQSFPDMKIQDYRGRRLNVKERDQFIGNDMLKKLRFRNVYDGVEIFTVESKDNSGKLIIVEKPIVFKKIEPDKPDHTDENSTYSLLHRIQDTSLIPRHHGHDQDCLRLELIGDPKKYGENTAGDTLTSCHDLDQLVADLSDLSYDTAQFFYAITKWLLNYANPKNDESSPKPLGPDIVNRFESLFEDMNYGREHLSPYVYDNNEYPFWTEEKVWISFLHKFRGLVDYTHGEEHIIDLRKKLKAEHEKDKERGDTLTKFSKEGLPGFVHLDSIVYNIIRNPNKFSEGPGGRWTYIDFRKMGIASLIFQLGFVASPLFTLGHEECGDSCYMGSPAMYDLIFSNLVKGLIKASQEDPTSVISPYLIPHQQELAEQFPSYAVTENIRMMGGIGGAKGFFATYGQDCNKYLKLHAHAAKKYTRQIIERGRGGVHVATFLEENVLNKIIEGYEQ